MYIPPYTGGLRFFELIRHQNELKKQEIDVQIFLATFYVDQKGEDELPRRLKNGLSFDDAMILSELIIHLNRNSNKYQIYRAIN